MKKLFIILLIFTLSSCKKFLVEDVSSVATNESFYATNNGLEALVVASYVSNKMLYAKEESYDFSDAATDMFTSGQQNASPEQFRFDPTFNAFNGRATILWVEVYKGVNACNEALHFLDKPEHPMLPALKIKRRAEILFLRAHYFWYLTETWGNVPMPLERTNSPVVTATRTPVKEIYKQIMADLNTAYSLFGDADNTSAADFGRVNKDAVRALLSRLNLTMASYLRHAGNPFGLEGTPEEYYTNALTFANEIINGNKYSFYSNYNDLWKLENNTGIRNSEVIWGVNYSRGTFAQLGVSAAEYQSYLPAGGRAYSEREGGHMGHMMWGTLYDQIHPASLIRSIAYDRPFCRYMPNKYLVDVFNANLDARFNGQFRTAWIANSNNPGPTWGSFSLPAGFVIPNGKTLSDPIYKPGDTAAVITIKDIPDNRIVKASNAALGIRFLYLDGPYFIWDYNLMYNPDGSVNITNTDSKRFFVSLKKFDDPGRATIAIQNGARDAYVFRLAEIYLIAAEAAHELNGSGFPFLQKLADTRSIVPNQGTTLLSAYGINSDADITVDKILDERAREFPGEQLRWFDLKRLHSPDAFVARLNKYLPESKQNMTQHHYLRPIPQIQFDAIQNAGEFGAQGPGGAFSGPNNGY